jgi:hypothetical protein
MEGSSNSESRVKHKDQEEHGELRARAAPHSMKSEP